MGLRGECTNRIDDVAVLVLQGVSVVPLDKYCIVWLARSVVQQPVDQCAIYPGANEHLEASLILWCIFGGAVIAAADSAYSHQLCDLSAAIVEFKQLVVMKSLHAHRDEET